MRGQVLIFSPRQLPNLLTSRLSTILPTATPHPIQRHETDLPRQTIGRESLLRGEECAVILDCVTRTLRAPITRIQVRREEIGDIGSRVVNMRVSSLNSSHVTLGGYTEDSLEILTLALVRPQWGNGSPPGITHLCR